MPYEIFFIYYTILVQRLSVDDAIYDLKYETDRRMIGPVMANKVDMATNILELYKVK